MKERPLSYLTDLIQSTAVMSVFSSKIPQLLVKREDAQNTPAGNSSADYLVFSGIINRSGQVIPVVCRHMKIHCPLSVDNLLGKLSSGLKIPVFADYSSQIRGVDPYMGANTFPINLALRRALEYVGLRFDHTGRGYDRTA